MATLAAKIKKAERQFSKARQRAKDEGMGANLPDAAYRGKIKEAKLAESQSNGALMHVLSVKIIEGESKGEVARKYSMMSSEDNLMYLQKDIARLGYDGFDSMDELEEINKELIGVKIRFKLVTKSGNDFQNMYIDKVLGSGNDDDEEPEGDGPEVPNEDEFTIGDRCTVEIEGEEYSGEVTEVGDGVCTIEFDDGDVQEIDNDDITLVEPDTNGDHPSTGTRVSAEIEDETYEGEITRKNDDDTYQVTFDDSEVLDFELDDLTIFVDPDTDPTADGGAGTLDVGDRVIADIDGTEYAGEITEMEGTTATVKFDDGDEDDYEVEDLVAEEGDGGDGDDVAVKKGSEVEVKVGRKTIDGTVTMVSSKKGTINIKDEDGDVHKDIPLDKILTVYGDDD